MFSKTTLITVLIVILAVIGLKTFSPLESIDSSQTNKGEKSEELAHAKASPPHVGTESLHGIDIRRPLYLREGSIACIDPADLLQLWANRSAFELLDNGKRYLSCLEWSGRRIRILERKDQIYDVVDADIPIELSGGQDSWVFESSLTN